MHHTHPGARPMTPHARRTALMLIACGAALAGTVPAAAQTSPPPPILDGTGSCALSVTRARLVSDVEQAAMAAYPTALRGMVQPREVVPLTIRVLADGTVDTASFSVAPTVYPEFREAARAVLPTMRFEPARVGGAAVAAWIRHDLPFQDPASIQQDGTYELTLEGRPVLTNGEELAPETRRDGSPAVALVRMHVSGTGTVSPSSIEIEMTTDPAIEEPARQLAQRMRFTPKMFGGRPLGAMVAIPIHFGCLAPGGDS